MKHTWLSLPLATVSCLIPLSAKAQVTPDGTTSTTVNGDGNNFTIEQGNRVGDNLFHSFDEFSVPTLGSAVFNNAGDIANIFSRVTGSSISSIDGLLGANGAANLYLINPNGITFGQNASLQLGGSFFASTADSLLFEGNTEFSAVNPEATPLLEVDIPIGARFRDNPGDIINRSFVQNDAGEFIGLEVQPTNNLILVGGNINFEAGEVTARGGNVRLGGLSEAGVISINKDGSLNFLKNAIQSDIELSNAAEIDVRGTGGGSITIDSRNLELTEGEFGRSSIKAGITPGSVSPSVQAGDISVNAQENIIIDSSLIENNVSANAIGNSGNININTSNLLSTNRTFISSSTEGQGNAGSVFINASDTISLNGNSGIFSQVLVEEAIGNGGVVDITTKDLLLDNTGVILTSTFGEGNAGDIIINAQDIVSLNSDSLVSSGIFLGGNGQAGNIEINSTNLEVNSNSRVDSSSFEGQGNAGNIIINTSNTVSLNNGDIQNGVGDSVTGNSGRVEIFSKNLFLSNNAEINSNIFGSGNGGNILINASNSVQISSNSFIQSNVSEGGSGRGGELKIQTRELNISSGGQLSTSTFGLGDGERIEIFSESIFIDGERGGRTSGIFSRVNERAQGNAGEIEITTNNLNISDEAQVDISIFGQTDSETENGNLNIKVKDFISLRNQSLISAQATGNNNGGNIIIDADSGFILAFPNQNNDIIAKAEQGNGGNINIFTQAIFGLEERLSTPPNQTNDIDASSEFGLQGDFTLNTPDFDPTTGLINLPASVGDASDQISQNPCQQGVGSQFIVSGKGGLPPSPTETLGSNEVEVGLVEPLLRQGNEGTRRQGEAKQTGEDVVTEAVPAMGWVFNDKGEVTLTAYSNTNTVRKRSHFPKTTCNIKNPD